MLPHGTLPDSSPLPQPSPVKGEAGNNGWRPGASFEMLRQRARLLARIRDFFADRLVMEVETPLLCHAGVTDPNLRNLETRCCLPGGDTARRLYLQTSPEYAMKRLLAADAGAIYQIGRVFRDGESGPLHNLEFTMVEWYRPRLDYHDIMEEVEDLLVYTLGVPYCSRLAYAEAFRQYAGLDPLDAPLDALHRAAVALGLQADTRLDRDGYLDFILSHAVAPKLGIERPTFLCDYPASQAALARLLPDDPRCAARFEVFIQGIEIANGFLELTDAAEQRRRFGADNARRQVLGLSAMPIDERLLAALEHGLPACAGVALGFDRLLMIATGARRIDEVLAFGIERA